MSSRRGNCASVICSPSGPMKNGTLAPKASSDKVQPASLGERPRRCRQSWAAVGWRRAFRRAKESDANVMTRRTQIIAPGNSWKSTSGTTRGSSTISGTLTRMPWSPWGRLEPTNPARGSSQSERIALIERHCELFGYWPAYAQENSPTARWASRARASSDVGSKQGHTALGARSGGGETGREGPCVALSPKDCR